MNYMAGSADAPADVTDRAVAQWREQRPDLDFSAMGPLARLARLAIIGGRLIDRVFEADGLDRSDFNVLAGLRRSGPPYRLTPSELADALLTTRGAMTKRVDRLEALGLVERSENGADRRSLYVGLTDEGMRRIDEIIVQHVENESRLLAVLTPNEVAALDHALRKLLRSIGDGG